MIRHTWIAVCFLLSGCSDTFDKFYPSYPDAVSDGAVLRGWMPNQLPDDAFHIREQHNIDNNRGRGVFHFHETNRDVWTNYFNNKHHLDCYKKIGLGKDDFQFLSKNNITINMESSDCFYDSQFFYIVDFQGCKGLFFTIRNKRMKEAVP